MKLLSRSLVSEYIRLEGLQKLTGTTAHDWDIYIVKELIDNALDADEALWEGTPAIAVEMQYDGLGLAVTVRNRATFDLTLLADILDFKKRSSVKDLYNLPTRGAQGNALKTILCIPYALQYHFFADFAPQAKPMLIKSGALGCEITLAVDEVAQSVVVHVTPPYALDHPIQGTEITVAIFKFTQQQPRTFADLKELAASFALWNPHATFTFDVVMKTELLHYAATGSAVWNKKYDLKQPAPLIWYTYGEFREVLYALLLHAREHGEPPPTVGDVGAFFGITAFPGMPELPATTPLSDLIQHGAFHPGKMQTLFARLKLASVHLAQPSLGEIGEEALRRGCQLDDAPATHFIYRKHDTKTASATPFVLEAAFCANTLGHRLILTGINHTPTYRDPFLNKPLRPVGEEVAQRGLEQLLDHYGLTEAVPITLALHLIAPTIIYENYGKSAISDEPYREALVDVIAQLVAAYQQMITPRDYLTAPARRILPVAIASFKGLLFSLNQLISAVKQALRALEDDNIDDDLAQVDADLRIRQVIIDYQATAPIRRLIVPRPGRLALPRHPADIVNVEFTNRAVPALLDDYQARAIVITHRLELEELLIALQFPMRYDLGILRAEGDLDTAILLLARTLDVFAAGDANHGKKFAPIWVLHDASIEGLLFLHTVRQAMLRHNVPTGIVVDFGLRPGDAALDDAWVEIRPGTAPLDATVVLDAGGDDQDLAFYIGRRASARLDSLSPHALLQWFDLRLQALHLDAKRALPRPAVAAVAGEIIHEQLRRVVEIEAFKHYHLDAVVADLVAAWQLQYPHWDAQLQSSIAAMQAADPLQSTSATLEKATEALVREFLNAKRLTGVQQTLRRS